MPSVVVAVVAVALFGFGYGVLPGRLPTQYQSLLESYQSEYLQAKSLDNRRLFRLASSIDLCFARLEAMGGVQGEALWQRADFYQSHAKELQARLEDFVGPVELREKVETQLAEFQNKHREIVETAAADDSPYFRDANLWLARRLLGSSHYQDDAGKKLRERLSRSLEQRPADDECRIALTELLVEAAWRMKPTEPKLDVNLPTLRRALEVAQGITDKRSAKRVQLECEILVHLEPQRAIAASQGFVASEAKTGADTERLAPDIFIGCVRGDWRSVQTAVVKELSTGGEGERVQVFRRMWARAIGRLMVSKLSTADGKWCSACPQGLRLALQMDPAAEELSALTWQVAAQHAGAAESLPAVLVESLLIGDVQEFRYLVLAISNAIRQQPEDAKTYLGLAGSAALPVLANGAIWYVQHDDQHYEVWQELLEASVQQDAQLGVSWFALGVIKLRREQFAEAVQSLTRAEELLGKRPSIESMLDAAKERLQTVSDPEQETPSPETSD